LEQEQKKADAAAAKKLEQQMESKGKGKGKGGAEDSWMDDLDDIIRQAMNPGGGGMESALVSIAKQYPQALQARAMATDSHPVSDELVPMYEALTNATSMAPLTNAISINPKPAPTGKSKEFSNQGAKNHNQKKPITRNYATKSFLETAGINSFSICFNDEGEEGALQLAPPKPANSLISVGTMHWGLDFGGISVGNASMPVKFCSPDSKKAGQMTACGAIPDSGTTLFMGPQKHIDLLYEDICDRWQRCRTAVSSGLQKKKLEIFQMLIGECGTWMTEENGLDEMPSLHFKVAGKDGTKQTLSIDAAGYIMEQQIPIEKMEWQEVMGIPLKMPVKTGKYSKVCAPAFGALEDTGMQTETSQNGAVWILGSSLFYYFTVGYDLNETAPAISFTEQSCGCSKETSLVSNSIGRARQLRKLSGPPRVSHFDLSIGL
jgi:hypothetical protein